MSLKKSCLLAAATLGVFCSGHQIAGAADAVPGTYDLAQHADSFRAAHARTVEHTDNWLLNRRYLHKRTVIRAKPRTSQRRTTYKGTNAYFVGSGFYTQIQYAPRNVSCRFLADCPCRYLAGC